MKYEEQRADHMILFNAYFEGLLIKQPCSRMHWISVSHIGSVVASNSQSQFKHLKVIIRNTPIDSSKDLLVCSPCSVGPLCEILIALVPVKPAIFQKSISSKVLY